MRMKMTSRMMMRMMRMTMVIMMMVMVAMVMMTRLNFVSRAEPDRRQRVQPVYRPSAFPEARSVAMIVIINIINIISRMMINIALNAIH